MINKETVLRELRDDGIISQEQYELAIKKYHNRKLDGHSVIEQFGQYAKDNLLSDTTIVRYKYAINLLLEHKYKTKDVPTERCRDITTEDIESFFKKQYEIDSGKYFNVMSAIKPFCKFLNSVDVTDININRLDEYTLTNSEQILSKDEIFDIVNCAESIMDKIIVLLAYECRIGKMEMIMIYMSDIHYGEVSTIDLYQYPKEKITAENFHKLNRDYIKTLEISDLLSNYIKQYTIELKNNIDEWNRYRKERKRPLRLDTDFLFQNKRSAIPSYGMVVSSLSNTIDRFCSMTKNNEEYRKITFHTLKASGKIHQMLEDKDSNNYPL